jgi:hypothetical protein
MSGWIEDDMNRHDRELLDRQMSRFNFRHAETVF